MSLRIEFAKTFAKFVEDNGLQPQRDNVGHRALRQGLSGARDTEFPNVIRGDKGKFYGVLFTRKFQQSVNVNAFWAQSLGETIVIDGIIKVYSPKYIQIFIREAPEGEGKWVSQGNNYYDTFLNAIRFLDLYLVKLDMSKALSVKGKTR